MAEDDPKPYHPEEDLDAEKETEFITTGVYRIPVFWLFCFDKGDLLTLAYADGESLPALVSAL